MALPAAEERTYERNFGHCIVSGKIKNFSLSMLNPETEIFTEEFTVTSSIVTRWRIGFRVKSNGKIEIVLKLVGGEPDKSLSVSWKMMILNGKDEATCVSENRTYIPIESEHIVYVISTAHMLEMLPAEKSDDVKIAFQIIVRMDTPMYIPAPDNVGLNALISDMKVILKESFLSDVTLMLKDKSINVHRAIVYPRCGRLSRYAGCLNRNIFLYLCDEVAIGRIFSYLYTVDLNSILVPPSISIYDNIMHLDIKELTNAYPQEKVSLETIIEATNYEFRWTILDFNSADEHRESEIFEADGMDCTWQLHMYPRARISGSEMQSMYVYIEALVVRSERSRGVYVDFKAKNDKGLITTSKRAYGKTTPGERLGVFFLRIGSSSMTKCVAGNVLDISFSAHIATGEINSTVLKYHSPVPFDVSNFVTYDISYYTGLLQNDETHSDITLLLGKQEIRAHKFLLGGRSTLFSRMIGGMETDSTKLTLPDMDKGVFRVFLEYLYRAVLTGYNFSVIPNLLNVAYTFEVESLVSICEALVTQHITSDNCCYILSCIARRTSKDFKESILRYIAANHATIIETEGWRNLERNVPMLYNEVVKFLHTH